MAIDDLIPRKDISEAVAPLTAGLMSKDWKVRKAALEDIEAAVNEAQGRIAPQVRCTRHYHHYTPCQPHVSRSAVTLSPTNI